MARNGKRALVTGGAGLIGSHVTDLLVREGWKVRVLDNLEPNTHKRGKPAWINECAEFVEGDLRDRDTITAALDKIDIVFHQAAYGGYMPEIAKFVHVNSLGTAQMLEIVREKICRLKRSLSQARKPFTAKAPEFARRTDWFFLAYGQWNSCVKAIGTCIARSAARSPKARRRRRTRQWAARPFTA
jgi:NAD(P)-dependent dehydrogenase (short-subunit alcohol dehydrogenase family)